MRCRILHESSGRMRVHFMQRRMTPDQADLLQAYLEAQSMIVRVRTDERTCNAVIWYRAGDRSGVVKLLASFGYDEAGGLVKVPEHSSRCLNRAYEDRLFFHILGRAITRFRFHAARRIQHSRQRDVPPWSRGHH